MIDTDTLLVSYVDNFLEEKNLRSLQSLIPTLNLRPTASTAYGNYGFRHNFTLEDWKENYIFEKIKKTFHPTLDLYPIEIAIHLKQDADKPKAHIDKDSGGEILFNFLLFLQGESLFNNGTGFYKNNDLSAHIGFVENRAVFFNGTKVLHGPLQWAGESSPQYTLNMFFRVK